MYASTLPGGNPMAVPKFLNDAGGIGDAIADSTGASCWRFPAATGADVTRTWSPLAPPASARAIWQVRWHTRPAGKASRSATTDYHGCFETWPPPRATVAISRCSSPDAYNSPSSFAYIGYGADRGADPYN